MCIREECVQRLRRETCTREEYVRRLHWGDRPLGSVSGSWPFLAQFRMKDCAAGGCQGASGSGSGSTPSLARLCDKGVCKRLLRRGLGLGLDPLGPSTHKGVCKQQL
ncbi:hypothetical protein AMTR_s00094p00134260 [Amborella trichopoda]|uniref:Uncharacterized protein n=1 Tax=Amborella trichopoda TaxID=13333 RepID=W1NTC0_AMBTC|nr:hypothetical protein AMTR_s00094p00134260 [Amborella trichopoda]